MIGPAIIPSTSPIDETPGRCMTAPVTSTIAGQIAWWIRVRLSQRLNRRSRSRGLATCGHGWSYRCTASGPRGDLAGNLGRSDLLGQQLAEALDRSSPSAWSSHAESSCRPTL